MHLPVLYYTKGIWACLRLCSRRPPFPVVRITRYALRAMSDPLDVASEVRITEVRRNVNILMIPGF